MSFIPLDEHIPVFTEDTNATAAVTLLWITYHQSLWEILYLLYGVAGGHPYLNYVVQAWNTTSQDIVLNETLTLDMNCTYSCEIEASLGAFLI